MSLTKEKTVLLQVRVDPMLKEAFLKACADNDRDGSQTVRDFMREYAKKHAQGDLLKGK